MHLGKWEEEMGQTEEIAYVRQERAKNFAWISCAPSKGKTQTLRNATNGIPNYSNNGVLEVLLW